MTTNDEAPEPLCTLTELSEVWGIPYTRSQIRRMRIAGKFPQPVRRGGRLVWRESQIVAYIAARLRLVGQRKRMVGTFRVFPSS